MKKNFPRKLIIFMLSIITVLLMISNATAVPITESQPYKETLLKLQNNISKVMKTNLYKKLETIVKTNSNSDIHSKSLSIVNTLPISNYFPLLVTFLQLLTEIIILLFGQIIGTGMATITVFIIAFIASAIFSIPFALSLDLTGLGEWEGVSKQWFFKGVYQYLDELSINWEYYGIIGSFIILLALIPLSVILFIALYPSAFMWIFPRYLEDIINNVG
jgi:hypothetical protein